MGFVAIYMRWTLSFMKHKSSRLSRKNTVFTWFAALSVLAFLLAFQPSLTDAQEAETSVGEEISEIIDDSNTEISQEKTDISASDILKLIPQIMGECRGKTEPSVIKDIYGDNIDVSSLARDEVDLLEELIAQEVDSCTLKSLKDDYNVVVYEGMSLADFIETVKEDAQADLDESAIAVKSVEEYLTCRQQNEATVMAELFGSVLPLDALTSEQRLALEVRIEEICGINPQYGVSVLSFETIEDFLAQTGQETVSTEQALAEISQETIICAEDAMQTIMVEMFGQLVEVDTLADTDKEKIINHVINECGVNGAFAVGLTDGPAVDSDASSASDSGDASSSTSAQQGSGQSCIIDADCPDGETCQEGSCYIPSSDQDDLAGGSDGEEGGQCLEGGQCNGGLSCINDTCLSVDQGCIAQAQEAVMTQVYGRVISLSILSDEEIALVEEYVANQCGGTSSSSANIGDSDSGDGDGSGNGTGDDGNTDDSDGSEDSGQSCVIDSDCPDGESCNEGSCGLDGSSDSDGNEDGDGDDSDGDSENQSSASCIEEATTDIMTQLYGSVVSISILSQEEIAVIEDYVAGQCGGSSGSNNNGDVGDNSDDGGDGDGSGNGTNDDGNTGDDDDDDGGSCVIDSDCPNGQSCVNGQCNGDDSDDGSDEGSDDNNGNQSCADQAMEEIMVQIYGSVVSLGILSNEEIAVIEDYVASQCGGDSGSGGDNDVGDNNDDGGDGDGSGNGDNDDGNTEDDGEGDEDSCIIDADCPDGESCVNGQCTGGDDDGDGDDGSNDDDDTTDPAAQTCEEVAQINTERIVSELDVTDTNQIDAIYGEQLVLACGSTGNDDDNPPGGGCTIDSDCPAGSLCLEGTCSGCYNNSQCGSDMCCNAQANLCVSLSSSDAQFCSGTGGPGCDSDLDCGSGVCANNQCVECEFDSDCWAMDGNTGSCTADPTDEACKICSNNICIFDPNRGGGGDDDGDTCDPETDPNCIEYTTLKETKTTRVGTTGRGSWTETDDYWSTQREVIPGSSCTMDADCKSVNDNSQICINNQCYRQKINIQEFSPGGE